MTMTEAATQFIDLGFDWLLHKSQRFCQVFHIIWVLLGFLNLQRFGYFHNVWVYLDSSNQEVGQIPTNLGSRVALNSEVSPDFQKCGILTLHFIFSEV